MIEQEGLIKCYYL